MFLKKFLKRPVLIVVIWFAATVATGFIYAGFDWSLYLMVCKTAGLWFLNIIILGFGILWIVRKVSFERLPKPVFFTIHGLAALAFSTIWTILAFLDLNIYENPEIKKVSE